MTVTGPPADAPPLEGPVLFDQRWLELIFLHWPVEPGSVARFMPPGVRPDVWEDGLTYVGLIPFRMARAGFGNHLPIPYFGSFLEWNVRLYSVDDAGRHGVVFRSLDATRAAVVAFANAGRIPYRWARIRTSSPAPDTVHWELRRRFSAQRSEVDVVIGEPVEPTPLEVFLTARWGMHSRLGSRAVWVQNAHGRWPLHIAELTHLDDTLVEAAGVRTVGPMLRPLWTPGVRARFAPPRFIA